MPGDPVPGPDGKVTDEVRRRNLRTGLFLAALALAFFVGIFLKVGVFR